MSATETINLRAAGGNPAADAPLVGTAQLPVPDERFPDDELWFAPIVSWNGRLFQYVSGSFGGFGPPVTPEYAEVTPVVVQSSASTKSGEKP